MRVEKSGAVRGIKRNSEQKVSQDSHRTVVEILNLCISIDASVAWRGAGQVGDRRIERGGGGRNIAGKSDAHFVVTVSV